MKYLIINPRTGDIKEANENDPHVKNPRGEILINLNQLEEILFAYKMLHGNYIGEEE